MSRPYIELWLCDDCTIAHANGDYPDYGTDKENEQRAREIDAGFEALARDGTVAMDDHDPSEEWLECPTCGHVCRKEDAEPLLDEDDGQVYLCPKCDSDEQMCERDDGRDEFSWAECDCCGSRLGGSRTRFALIPNKDSNEAPTEA